MQRQRIFWLLKLWFNHAALYVIECIWCGELFSPRWPLPKLLDLLELPLPLLSLLDTEFSFSSSVEFAMEFELLRRKAGIIGDGERCCLASCSARRLSLRSHHSNFSSLASPLSSSLCSGTFISAFPAFFSDLDPIKAINFRSYRKRHNLKKPLRLISWVSLIAWMVAFLTASILAAFFSIKRAFSRSLRCSSSSSSFIRCWYISSLNMQMKLSFSTLTNNTVFSPVFQFLVAFVFPWTFCACSPLFAWEVLFGSVLSLPSQSSAHRWYYCN